MRTLELSQEKRANVYNESQYMFLILHAHGSIWKEREQLTSNKKEIKHAAEILKLFRYLYRWQLHTAPDIRKRTLKWLKETIWPIKREASKRTFKMPLVPILDLLQFDSEYSTVDSKKAWRWGFDQEGPGSGKKRNKKGVILLSEHLVEPITKHLHEVTHCARDSLTSYMKLCGSQVLKPCGKL